MEDNGDGEELTPFWLQSTADLRRGDRLRRGVSSFFFSLGLVVFLLLVAAGFFLVFVVPSTLSFTAQIFRPNSVKKSWDSLNVVLVLVAVVFGFLSRNRNEERYSTYEEFQATPRKENESQKSNPSTPNKWYNYDGQTSNLSSSVQWYQHSDAQTRLEHKNSVMRRNSTSYPDLREFPSVDWSYGGDYYQRRFHDDLYVDPGRVPDTGKLHHRRHRSLEEVDSFRAPLQTKTVIVDTLQRKSEKAADSPPPPPISAQSKIASPQRFEGSDTNDYYQRRFYDDLYVDPGRVPDTGKFHHRRHRSLEEGDSFRAPLLTKTVIVDTLQRKSEKAADSPPPPISAQSKRPSPQRFEGSDTNGIVVVRKEKSTRRVKRDPEFSNSIAATTPPPPPPLPQKINTGERKRRGATGSATKDFLTSLYHKKKSKQRQKSVDNLDSLLHEVQVPLTFQLPPPTPPPPPPVFKNLFSIKKQKRTRTIKVTLKPPTQPEPNPNSQIASLTSHKSPKPIQLIRFDKLDENSNSGGESPLSRIPPPPPPPPPQAFLKNPAWKFVVQGDYVRVNSITSSRSGSPDPDELDSDVTPSATDGGDITPFHPSPLFCPSPDVNTKAESFISNFRAKLKLEKIDSMKKTDLGRSSLGPKPGPSEI